MMAIRRKLRLPHPLQSFYSVVFNDGDGGVLKNMVTGESATLNGGSTQTDATMKFYDNYQVLNGNIKGVRCSAATSNLLASLSGGTDNTTFEGGTTGDWNIFGSPSPGGVSTDWAAHGAKSLHLGYESYPGGNPSIGIASITTAGQTYTAQVRLKVITGSACIRLWDNVSGGTDGNTITDEGLSVVTKTFDASSTDRILVIRLLSFPIELYIDAVQLVSGSSPLPFTSEEATEAYATIPTPFSAGEPFTALFFVWTPWAGDDGANHMIFDVYEGGGVNRVYITKYSGNYVQFVVMDDSGDTRSITYAVNSTNWPAGSFHAVAVSREGNTLRLAFDGDSASNLSGTGGTETSLPDTSYIGRYPYSSAVHFNGIILPFFWSGYAAGDEEMVYLSSLKGPLGRLQRLV